MLYYLRKLISQAFKLYKSNKFIYFLLKIKYDFFFLQDYKVNFSVLLVGYYRDSRESTSH